MNDPSSLQTAQSRLGPRLFHIMEACGEGHRLIDVGCDHALVPTALLHLKRFECALATDIHRAPLERAQERLAKEMHEGRWSREVLDRLSFRHTPGLEGIELDEGDTVVIAGMGGFEIVDILLDASSLMPAEVHFVVGPQKSLAELLWLLGAHGIRPELEVIHQDGVDYPIVQWRSEAGNALRIPEAGAEDLAIDMLYGLHRPERLSQTFIERQRRQWTYDLRAAKRWREGTQARWTHPVRVALYRTLLAEMK